MGINELILTPWTRNEENGAILANDGRPLWTGDRTPEQDEAIANLLYAAPDLLDALIDIVSVAKQIPSGPLWAYSKEIVRARDLITRAKGLT